MQFLDTSARFILGHPLGALGSEAFEGSPVDGKSFLKAWQFSLRSCSIRNALGSFRFVVSKAESFDHYDVVHRLIDFHINHALDDELHQTSHNLSVLKDLLQRTDNRQEMRNQAIQLMMASQDTSAILLSNAIFLLARNPAVWARLRDEAGSRRL